jgi:hypothetical protein
VSSLVIPELPRATGSLDSTPISPDCPRSWNVVQERAGSPNGRGGSALRTQSGQSTAQAHRARLLTGARQRTRDYVCGVLL